MNWAVFLLVNTETLVAQTWNNTYRVIINCLRCIDNKQSLSSSLTWLKHYQECMELSMAMYIQLLHLIVISKMKIMSL